MASLLTPRRQARPEPRETGGRLHWKMLKYKTRWLGRLRISATITLNRGAYSAVLMLLAPRSRRLPLWQQSLA
jgi:hypothetical protein